MLLENSGNGSGSRQIYEADRKEQIEIEGSCWLC